MEKKIPNHWYENTGTVFILCILIFPLGLYGLWKSNNISKPVKHIVSALILIVCFKGGEYFLNKQHEKDRAILEQHLYDSINQVEAIAQMKADSIARIKKIMSAEETVSYVLDFEKKISTIEKPACNAINQATQFMKYFSNGQTTVNEVYEAAKIAKKSCEIANSKLYDYSLSKNLPDSIAKMLRKILSNISTAYYMRKTGYENLMEYCDKGKPSDLSAYREEMEGAYNFSQSCAIDMTATKLCLGIPLKKGEQKKK